MANPFDEPNPFDDVETPPAQQLTEHDGIKRLELHKTSPDTSDTVPAPEKSREEKLLDDVRAMISPKSATGAFTHGAANGASLGFADEAYGALAGGSDTREKMSKIAEESERAKAEGRYGDVIQPPPQVLQSIRREGQPDINLNRPAASPNDTETPKIDELADYRTNRDSFRNDLKTAEQAHPALYAGGELAGSFAVPLPGTGKAKGLAKVGKYAAQGGGVGFLSGLGNSNGDAGDALLDATKSGVGGAALGGALGYGASKLDPILERAAAKRAYKAMDPYMASIAKGLGSDVASGKAPISEANAEMQRLGRRMLDEGIIPEGPWARFTDAEGINNRAVQKLEEAGQLKGATVDHAADELKKLGQPNPVSMGQLATRIEQEAAQAKVSGNQDLARKLLKEARDIRQTVVDRASAGFADPAAQTLQDAEKFKTMMQGKVDYGAPLARREAQTTAARLAKEQAENAIEKGLGPEDLEQFKAVKDRYGDLATLADTSGHGAIRQFRNQSSGLGNKLVANIAAHAATGPAAIPVAAAASAAHGLTNHRMSAALARSLQDLSESNQSLTPLAQWRSLIHNDDDQK